MSYTTHRIEKEYLERKARVANWFAARHKGLMARKHPRVKELTE